MAAIIRFPLDAADLELLAAIEAGQSVTEYEYDTEAGVIRDASAPAVCVSLDACRRAVRVALKTCRLAVGGPQPDHKRVVLDEMRGWLASVAAASKIEDSAMNDTDLSCQ